MRQSLLQNGSAFLLQNATVLSKYAIVFTKCDVYYKMCQYSDLNSNRHNHEVVLI